jgi:hypothetical protein
MYALGWCLSMHVEYSDRPQPRQASKGANLRMLNAKAGCQNKRMGE